MSNDLDIDPFGEPDEAEETTSEGPRESPSTGILGKWYVLYPLCAIVLVGALYVGLRLQSRIAGPIRVTLATEPEDVIVLEAGKELKPAEDGTYLLARGKHELTFRREGYRTQTYELVVSAEQNRFEMKLERLAGRPVVVEILPSDAELRVNGVVRATPDGRTELRPPDQGPLVLQATHPDYRPFRRSYFSRQLEASDYRLRVELAPLAGGPGLPGGLVPKDGAEIDAELELPTRVLVESPMGDAPLELLLIKPGEFEAGVSSADLHPGELAPRQVRIERPLYVAVTETTNEQYAEFAEAVGDEQAGTDWRDLWQQQDGAERLPVVGVSVAQAEAFCAWLGGRLPTEEEWEFAARGPGEGSVVRPWGKQPLDPSRCNLFFGESTGPVPVDSLPDGSTPTGLRHMLGNVAEWCSDAYQAGFGESDAAPEFAGKNVIRGCSFAKSADAEARLTWRAPEGPEGTPDVGFRVVCDVEPGAGN
jgi:formylglycine-generating enzyme required for sulfatase activity